MDIAIAQDTGFVATGIEQCQCDPEYRGLSCQDCAVGYYRDSIDRSHGDLGRCKPCDCSGNERSCAMDTVTGKVTCQCKPGYTGGKCELKGMPNQLQLNVMLIATSN